MALQKPGSSERARQLRKSDTQAERRLWEAIRDRRLAGYKFVRQLPVGPYFADFACRECKLIIELDGATHGTDEAAHHDERHSALLGEQGYRVIRFFNEDIYRNLEDACGTIVAALDKR